MEIDEIKAGLPLKNVLQHYQLYPDKQARLCCPFHEDKTPSLQVYYKTQTAYCFSSNCSTHGKSMDVIDFIMHKEGISKHQAIEKAVQMIGGHSTSNPAQTLTRQAVLTKMFAYFKNAVHNSAPAKEYLQRRNLDFKQTEVGYNAGQYHHGTRKDEALIKSCIAIGLLHDSGNKGRTGDTAYNVFGKWGIVFALKNKDGHISGLYFRSTLNDKESKHFYLKDRAGLYPCYPKAATKKLILTEAIIDAATLLQVPQIAAAYSVLACYGTNGLTEEHLKAIKSLTDLEEVIFFFDGDPAGTAAVNKYGKTLSELLPGAKITAVPTPQGEDINSLAQGHEAEVLTHLLDERAPRPPEGGVIAAKEAQVLFSDEKNKSKPPAIQELPLQGAGGLDCSNPHQIKFTTATAKYYVQGGLRKEADSLKITLAIENPALPYLKSRLKYDLYNDKDTERNTKEAADKLNLRADLLQTDISLLTDLLEAERDKQVTKSNENPAGAPVYQMNEESKKKCLDFLNKPGLIQNINALIGKAGVTGEDTNRIFLYCIASSYKMNDTLHALVQGSSGSGKTHLIIKIAGLMPPEDVTALTRVTESSFYNYGEYELSHTLLCFEDLDGMKEEALLALRELMSREVLTSSTSIKDESGNIRAAVKTVRGPIASLSATTKGEIYEDNMGRAFLIAVDESKAQTQKIIQYQNDKAAGLTDTTKEKDIKAFLQNCIRLLKPYEVINPYANKIQLPDEAHKIRRLNELYQAFVKQVTLLNQYQRKKDDKGRLIAEKEDLKTACDIMFESILLKVDELDGSLRQYFEQVKSYISGKGKDHEFTRIELRQQLKMGKTLQHNYMGKLLSLEYIRQSGGHINRGFHYKITHWDDMSALRAKLKEQLNNQLQNL
jgi:DNA primase